jgi:hypothetical protein
VIHHLEKGTKQYLRTRPYYGTLSIALPRDVGFSAAIQLAVANLSRPASLQIAITNSRSQGVFSKGVKGRSEDVNSVQVKYVHPARVVLRITTFQDLNEQFPDVLRYGGTSGTPAIGRSR